MNWFALSLAITYSGFVQDLAGFGFGLVSMSFLPAVLGMKRAAAISTVFSLMATVTTFIRHCRDYEWRLGLSFLISACVGVPAGVYFLETTSETTLHRLLGLLMICLSLREFLLKPIKSIPHVITVPFGFFSGGLSGAFNLGGIPSAAYAYAHPWSRGHIIAFLQVLMTCTCTLRLICYKRADYFHNFSWFYAALLAVPLYLSIWLGHTLMRRVDPVRMRKGIFIFVGLAGIYYLCV